MDYRVYINKLGKKGNMLFAQVRIPPQIGLPKGRHGLKWYPAIVKPSVPQPRHPMPAPGGSYPKPNPKPNPGGYPKPAPGYPTPGGIPRPGRPPWMP